eukprot:12385495-Alexandrium_andersonii.AAC.1
MRLRCLQAPRNARPSPYHHRSSKTRVYLYVRLAKVSPTMSDTFVRWAWFAMHGLSIHISYWLLKVEHVKSSCEAPSKAPPI